MAVMRIHNIVVLFIAYMVCHPFFWGAGWVGFLMAKIQITNFSIFFLKILFFNNLYVSIREVKFSLQASVIYHS